MPLSVTCACGKMFKVRDDLAGTQVSCQVCGSSIAVPLPGQGVQVAPVAHRVETPPPAAPAAAGAMKACPSCAEQIPANVFRCPFCKEQFSEEMPVEQQREQLAKLLGSVRNHDPQSDAMSRGGFFAGKTIVLASLSGLSLLGIAAGFAGTDLEGLAVAGIIFLLIFGIAFLVSAWNDYQASHIQDAASAEKALRRYLLAAQTNRSLKAYYALAPHARTDAPVAPPPLEKIPANNAGPSQVNDPESFKSYLLTIFKGPSLNSRMVQFKKTRLVAEHDSFAVVEVEVAFSSYPTLLLLTILISLLIAIILVLVLTKKETHTVRKLLIKHEGRWYIADPGFEGAIDQVAAKAAATF